MPTEVLVLVWNIHNNNVWNTCNVLQYVFEQWQMSLPPPPNWCSYVVMVIYFHFLDIFTRQYLNRYTCTWRLHVTTFVDIAACANDIFFSIWRRTRYALLFFFIIITSVDTEMCFPKGKCGCQYFILLNKIIKKKMLERANLGHWSL